MDTLNTIKRILRQVGAILIALAIVILVLFTSISAADSLRESAMVAQSKVLRSIFLDETVGISSFLTDKNKQSMLKGFLRAVADAYIAFELIPVNEGKTFTVIFQSINDDILIENFSYHRRDLRLQGVATPRGYRMFLKEIKKSGHFYSIEERSVITMQDQTITFIIDCLAEPLAVPGLTKKAPHLREFRLP